MKKRKIIVLFLIIFILLFNIAAFANSPTLIKDDQITIYEHLGRDIGLSNLSISSIIQDKYGFMWFGTQNGLNLYNGIDMKIYKKDPFSDDCLIHNLIQTMYYDYDNHQLWIGTYQGVSQYIIEDNVFVNYSVSENGLSNPIVVSITKDSNGFIWIGTLEGLNKLDPQTGLITNYKIPGNVVRDLFIDSNDNLLIASYEGLLKYNEKNDTIDTIFSDLSSPYIMDIDEFSPGKISLGLWDGGIDIIDLSTGEKENISFENNNVYYIYKTEDGYIWAGTWGSGLFGVAPDGNIFNINSSNQNDGLSHDIVYSLLQDESGIFWIGTNGGGITTINPRKSNYVKFEYDKDNPTSLSNGKINSIFRDTHDNLWIAVYNSGLLMYNKNIQGFIKYLKDDNSSMNLISNQINDIIQFSDNIIMFTSDAGVMQYNLDTKIGSLLDLGVSNEIYYSIKKLNDSTILLGSYLDGLYIINIDTLENTHYSYDSKNNFHISDNLIYDILIDSKQRIWVATNNGLNVKMPDSNEFISYLKPFDPNEKTLASNSIRCLFEDSKGRIWIGTSGGGLSQYNELENNFTTFTEKDGLPDNTITSIQEQNSNIWVSTSNGLGMLNTENNNINILTPKDGIGFWEFTTGSFKESDGSILFGASNGIILIPADSKISTPFIPNLYITNVIVNNKPLSNMSIFNDTNLIFESYENSIEFDFLALDYDNPKQISYSYKLDGYNDNWVDIGNDAYAVFSNLPSGKYEFLVKATHYKDYKTELQKFSFVIKRPWYLSIIMILVYMLILLFIFFSLFELKKFRYNKRINSKLNILNDKLRVSNEKLKEANEKLKELSSIDQLTDLYNRRYFNIKTNNYIKLCKRTKTNLSLLMFDVDNFKKINDNLGHLEGDKHLKSIAKEITSLLIRKTDFIARYGGDEFIILLYDTNINGAEIIANRIMNVYKKMDSTKGLKLKNIYTSLSMGILSFTPKTDTKLEDVLHQVDKALYIAKNTGKDKYEIISLDSE